MNHNPTEKKTRNKITRNFFLVVLAGGVFGGIIGFSSNFFESRLSGLLSAINIGLQISSPWVNLLIGAVALLVSFLTLGKAKTLSTGWDGEDEASYEQIDQALTLSMGSASVGTILTMSWYGLTVVARFHDRCSIVLFLVSTALFVLYDFFFAFLQRKGVDLMRALNPEKRGDALSLHFQKEWLESCDEQEKLRVYRASYKAFTCLPVVCGAIFVLLLLGAMNYEVGILPFLITGGIWLTQTLIYLIDSSRRN